MRWRAAIRSTTSSAAPTTKFSKTNHLASTVTQVQKIEKGRWVVVKGGLMF